jgi:uncharacterized membrane protein YqaE (UPF0057 family)
MKAIFALLFIALISSGILSPANASMLPGIPGNSSVSVSSALKKFNQLSKKEIRKRKAEVKNVWKKFKKKENHSGAETSQLLLIILAILLPPLAVYLYQEEITAYFWISILLWFLFIIPGVIFALLVVTDTIQ